MTAREFLRTHPPEFSERYGFAKRPKAALEDGTVVSIQSGLAYASYTEPDGNVIDVEIACPYEEMLRLYLAPDYEDAGPNERFCIYRHVPVTAAEIMVSRHGGIIGPTSRNIGRQV